MEEKKRYKEARSSYRQLKTWHQNHSLYDTAGEFHYREWECKRKLAKKEARNLEAWQLAFYRLLFGYGEKPWRVVLAGALAITLFTLFYFPYAWSFCFEGPCWREFGVGMGKAFYFSGVSFTALGYGDWVTTDDIGVLRYLGFVESAVGILTIALFLVTFTKKMMQG